MRMLGHLGALSGIRAQFGFQLGFSFAAGLSPEKPDLLPPRPILAGVGEDGVARRAGGRRPADVWVPAGGAARARGLRRGCL